MKRVEQGEEQVVIPPQKEKEFTEIGNAFNNMTKQLAAQRAENEKMAQSRQKMLLELSHDIKTPVATIKSIFMHFRNRWFRMWTFQNIMKRLRESRPRQYIVGGSVYVVKDGECGVSAQSSDTGSVRIDTADLCRIL